MKHNTNVWLKKACKSRSKGDKRYLNTALCSVVHTTRPAIFDAENSSEFSHKFNKMDKMVYDGRQPAKPPGRLD